MLEKPLIQSQGFRNTGRTELPDAFEVRVRSPYYRGVWANLIEQPSVSVDGEEFDGANVRWRFPSGEYTLAELRDSVDVRWPLEHAAVLRIPKPGGLSVGVHHVSVTLRMRMSYIPEEIQPQAWTTSRKVVIVE